jgi:hypothetical protein
MAGPGLARARAGRGPTDRLALAGERPPWSSADHTDRSIVMASVATSVGRLPRVGRGRRML